MAKSMCSPRLDSPSGKLQLGMRLESEDSQTLHTRHKGMLNQYLGSKT